MTALVLLGALLGAAVVALAWHLAPRRLSPLVALGRFDAHTHDGLPAAGSGRVTSWLAGRLGPGSHRSYGQSWTTLGQDLALIGRSPSWLARRKLLTAATGFTLALMSAAVLRSVVSASWPPGVEVAAGVLTGAGFFLLPDLDVRREAEVRRTEFRHVFGAYLDLVALEMAGAAAPAEALPSAARVGAGWPMALIRDTLWRATRSGRDPWAALTDLGHRIGVAELRDLGALVELVGRDGARVRETLTARAAAMRRTRIAEAAGEAGRQDESMRMAQILIGVGFIVFVTYPAVVSVLQL